MDIVSESKNIYAQKDTGLTSRIKIAIDELKDGDEVLEIGVGWGEFTKNVAASKKISLSVVDVAESALNNVRGYVKDSQLADISQNCLKYPEDQFDAVVCLEVFEHLQNPYHALTEIQRVLKPGGKLILSIPNYLGGHLMIYPGLMTFGFFKSFLRQNYFKINKIHFWGPVLNKDNAGRFISSKINNAVVALALLRIIQVAVKLAQLLAELFILKAARLYWCYFFICENCKGRMGAPFWLKQLKQTSELGSGRGWYDGYFHKKV